MKCEKCKADVPYGIPCIVTENPRLKDAIVFFHVSCYNAERQREANEQRILNVANMARQVC